MPAGSSHDLGYVTCKPLEDPIPTLNHGVPHLKQLASSLSEKKL
jgi:hypothetical protein